MNITCPNCGVNPVKLRGLEPKAPTEPGGAAVVVKHVKCPGCGNTGTVDVDGASWSKTGKRDAAGTNASAPIVAPSKTATAAPMNIDSRYIPRA